VQVIDPAVPCCPFRDVTDTQTDASGNYAFVVAAGSYKVQFFEFPLPVHPHINQWWQGKPDDRQADLLVVTGDRPNIDAVLTAAVALHGRVTDATGAVAVVGFQVNALDATAPCCQFFGGAQTDAQGNYSIAVPIGSSVKVSFGSFNGPPPGTRYLPQWWNNKPSFEAADPIFAGADVLNIDAHLANGLVISGHVSEPGGAPLPGVQVQVIDPAVACCPFREVAHTQTNATGDYTAVVPSGSYKVQFFEFPPPAHPHMPQWWQGKPFDQGADVLVVAADRPNIDAILMPAVFIRGRVTDSTGAVGIGAVNVSSSDATLPCCQFVSGSQTDPLGNYAYLVPLGSLVKVQFGPPPGSRYTGEWWNEKTTFDSADPIRADADHSGIDARLATGLVVSGRVTDSLGLGLAGFGVDANDATLPCCQLLAGAQTDGLGNYQLVLPAGSHVRIFFGTPPGARYLPEWWNDKPFFDVADVIDISGDRSGIDARLAPAVLIRGRVTDSTGTVPVSGLQISARDASVPGSQYIAGAQTDSLGNYTMPVPQGAAVKIEFGVFGGMPPGTRYIGEWWNHKASFETADVVIASIDQSGIDARLAAGFAISGIVRGPSGPLANVFVAASLGGPAPCCTGVGGTVTDAVGRYQLTLPAGTYRLSVSSPPTRHLVMQWWNGVPAGTAYFQRASDILLGPSDAPGRDFDVVFGAIIEGHVTDSAGAALGNVGVNANDASIACCEGLAFTGTDGSGNYALVVPLGRQVRVFFGPGPGSPYSAQWWNNKPDFGVADVINATTDRSGIDARLESGGPFVVSGHVSERGTGIALSGIRVQPFDAGVPCCPQPAVGDGTVTDAFGNYELTLPVGRYKLVFYQFPLGDRPHYVQWWHDRTFDFEGDVLVVSGPTPGIDQQLPIAVWISGRVTDATGTIPVVGLQVSAQNAAFPCCRFVDGAQTDAAGNYRFIAPIGTGLKIEFGVFGPPGQYIGEWWSDKSTYDAADVLLADADRSGIDARLAAASAGSISGHVTDRATGLPIANIDVQAFDAVSPCCSLAGTRTNANGDYTLTLAGAATVKLVFQSPDPGPAYVARWWHDQSDFGPAGQIVVSGAVTNIDQALDAGYRISGRVTDSANPGVGVPDVGVLAQPNFSCCLYGTRSGADGRYSLIVSAATYRISFFSPLGSDFLEQWWNGKPGFSAADLLTVPSSSVDLGSINAALIHGIPVSGRVTAPGGTTGVDRVGVVATLDDPAVPCCINYQAQTDSSGDYTMYVRAGRYRINFQPPNTTDYVVEYWDDQPDFASATLLNVVGPTPNIDATLELGFRISGRVTDANGGAAVPNSAVTINPLPCCSPPMVQLTGPDGTYSAVVRAGSYKIGFNGPFGGDLVNQYWNAKPDFVSGDILVVNAAQPNIDAVLAHGVRLSGRVTDASDPTRGIAGVNVAVATPADNRWVAGAATSADGSYSIFVAPGSYVMYFSPPFGTDFLLEYWNDKSDFATADVITVTGPPMANLDAALSHVLTISGRVTNDAGDPIPGIIVNVDRSELPFTFVMSAVTDADGRYSANLPAGRYKVFFFPGVGVPYIGEWWRDKTTFATADVIDVSTTVPNVDGVLARGVLVTGRVTVAGTGAALSGASVILYDASQPCCVALDGHATLSDGTYSFAVPAGSYWVSFLATGYAEQWWDAKTSSLSADILSGPADHLNINAAMVPTGP